jgi:ubiquinone biosynthesis protein UbiJ
MNNTSPFSFLESIVTRFQPPAWLVDEGQQRLVLFLNHVLLQEKQAQDRLLGQKGRVVHLRWELFALDLIVTPAGLVDRAPPFANPDLVLSVVAESPLAVVQSALAGKAPPVKIEGDVQLAAEIGWLAENLRWDAEEDLSRLIGDAPAHALADAGRRLASSLKQFFAKGPLSPSATATPSTSTSTVSTFTTPPPDRRAAPTTSGSEPSGITPAADIAKAATAEPGGIPDQVSSVPAGESEANEVKGVMAPPALKASA